MAGKGFQSDRLFSFPINFPFSSFFSFWVRERDM